MSLDAPRLRMGLLVVLSTVVMAGLALTAPASLRVPAVVLWLLLVPGLPWAARLRLGDRGDTVAVAVAVSLALAVVVGGGMAVLGTWSPPAGVLVLLLISLSALVPGRHDLRRSHR